MSDESPGNTNKPVFPMLSKWRRVDFVTGAMAHVDSACGTAGVVSDLAGGGDDPGGPKSTTSTSGGGATTNQRAPNHFSSPF